MATDAMQEQTPFAPWTGIDPSITEPRSSAGALELLPGYADQLPFDSESFRVAMFANVYEHVLPDRRMRAFREIRRVLTPGVRDRPDPNPYFPIESHSRLPFMGWLPTRAQKSTGGCHPFPGSTTSSSSRCDSCAASADRLGAGRSTCTTSTTRPR